MVGGRDRNDAQAQRWRDREPERLAVHVDDETHSNASSSLDTVVTAFWT